MLLRAGLRAVARQGRGSRLAAASQTPWNLAAGSRVTPAAAASAWTPHAPRRWLATDDKAAPRAGDEEQQQSVAVGARASATGAASAENDDVKMKEEQDGDDEEDWEWVPPSKNRASSEDENPSEDGEDANAELEDRDVLNIKVDEAMDAAVWMTQSEDNAEEDYARHRRKREASWTWESGLVERETKLIRAIPGELLTLEEVKACLEANGGENIVSVTGEESGMREDSVIVTGRSSQHILRLAKILHKSMRKRGLRSSHENKPYDADENWVVLDAGSILVHVFTQEGRDFMKLDDKLLPDRRDEQMEEHKQDMFERNTEDRAKRRRRSKRKRMPYDEEDAM